MSVSSQLARACTTLGADVPPEDTGANALGTPCGIFVDRGYRTGSPIERGVAWELRPSATCRPGVTYTRPRPAA